MDKLFPVLISAIVGATLAIQGPMNAQVRASFGSAIWAAAINFSVGLITLLAAAFLFQHTPPTGESIKQTPLWAFWGGTLGAAFVVCSAFLIRSLGTTSFLTFTIAGQLIMAVVLDHFGVLGLNAHPISSARIFGCAALIVGAYLVRL